MSEEFAKLVAGMTGAQLIEAINGNSDLAKATFETLAANILLRVIANNVKEIKSENGKLFFTLDGENWLTTDNNVWGSITGDISDQTDLINALGEKADNSSVNSLGDRVTSLGTSVSSLGESVSKNARDITANSTAIGSIQAKQSKQVSSDTILQLRISSGGYLQYSTNGVNWVNVQSIAEINWGAIGGEISNQVDLQTILNNKVNASQLNSHTGNKENPHEVTKEQVGLSEVDNTSDLNKPISTAAQEVIDGIQTSISELNNNKISVTDDVKAVRYITLSDWNELKEAGELDATTLYFVD